MNYIIYVWTLLAFGLLRGVEGWRGVIATYIYPKVLAHFVY